MDKLVERLPQIIEQSAKTPLGIVALAVITLAIIAFLFFRKSKLRVRVAMFLSILIGSALLIGQMLWIEREARKQSIGGELIEGRVVAIDGVPPASFRVLVDEKNDGEVLLNWIRTFFDAKVVVDIGQAAGIVSGDYFGVSSTQTRIANNEGRQLGMLRDDTALIRVIDVQSNMSICQLVNWAYESHIRRALQRLHEIADKDGNIPENKALELLSPVIKGQRVYLIKRDEKEAWDAIVEMVKRAENSLNDRSSRYREALASIDPFLMKFPSGYFTPDVLFTKGDLQEKLGEPENAADTFDLYVKRFPFHPSASGARERSENLRAPTPKGKKA